MRENHRRMLFDAAAAYYAYENSVFASDSVPLVQSSQAFSELMLSSLGSGSATSRSHNGSTEYFAQNTTFYSNLVFHRKAGLVPNTTETLEPLIIAATNTANNADYLEGYGDHLRKLKNTCMAYHINSPVGQEMNPSKGDSFLKRVISLHNQFNWFKNEAKVNFALDAATSLMIEYPELVASLGYAKRSNLEDGSLTIKLTSDSEFGCTNLLIELTEVESNVMTSITLGQDSCLTVSQNPQVDGETMYSLKYHDFPIIISDINSNGETLNIRPELDEKSLYAPLENANDLHEIISHMFYIGLPVTPLCLKEVGGQIELVDYARLLSGSNIKLGTDYFIDDLQKEDALNGVIIINYLLHERAKPIDGVVLATELSNRYFDLDKLLQDCQASITNESDWSRKIMIASVVLPDIKENIFYEVYQSLELAKVLDSSIEDAFTPLDDINHETEACLGFSL
jgi:hypothetical protein